MQLIATLRLMVQCAPWFYQHYRLKTAVVWLGMIHFQAFPSLRSSFGGVCWFSSSAKLKMERQNVS